MTLAGHEEPMSTLVPNGRSASNGDGIDRVARIGAALRPSSPVVDPRVALAGVESEEAVALIDQLAAELAKARQAAVDLSTALESNREIGAATGILMAKRHVTQAEAFDLLRVASQTRHVKLRALAREVVETGALLPAPPSPSR